VVEENQDATGDWEDPDRLEALAPIAQRVTLGEGGTVSIDLTPRPAPR
jgi:hypothetical protein